MIFLIGFMGSGKSSVGIQLAKYLNILFLDSDKWIEDQQQKSISTIFEQQGEEKFRLLEKEFIDQLDKNSGIISCGGGLPCFNGLMKEIKSKGTVIYLEAEVETLVKRLRNERSERPLLNDLSDEDLEASVRTRLASRAAFYEMADIRIRVDNLSVEEIVQQISKEFDQSSSSIPNN